MLKFGLFSSLLHLPTLLPLWPSELGRVVLSSPQFRKTVPSSRTSEKKWHFNQELRNLQSHITSLSTKIATSKVIPSSRAESASDFSSELSSGFISSWTRVLVDTSWPNTTKSVSVLPDKLPTTNAHTLVNSCLNAAMHPANLRFSAGHAEALGRFKHWDQNLAVSKNLAAMTTMTHSVLMPFGLLLEVWLADPALHCTLSYNRSLVSEVYINATKNMIGLTPYPNWSRNSCKHPGPGSYLQTKWLNISK